MKKYYAVTVQGKPSTASALMIEPWFDPEAKAFKAERSAEALAFGLQGALDFRLKNSDCGIKKIRNLKSAFRILMRLWRNWQTRKT